jgi:hypothetical protein
MTHPIGARRSNGLALAPWMRPDEIAAMRRLIRERRPHRVLEFGAGGSTVTFNREPSIREWWTLEHSPKWISKVLATLEAPTASKVTLVSCPEENVLRRINQLLPIGFAMFFVDGFDRCAILDRLRTHLVTEPGFIVLHDSSRPRYRQAMEQFTKRTALAEGDGKHQGLMLLEM